MKGVIILLVFISVLGLVSAADSVIRDGDCNAGETCLMSLYQMNDSNVAECGYYNYSVCYPGVVTVTNRAGSCNANEFSVMSKYQANDTNAASSGYFDNSICVVGHNSTYISSSCAAGDTGIISMYQSEDTNVGAVGYFDNQLCENDSFTADTIPPTFTNCRNFTATTNISFSQSITATDASGIDGYFLNDTSTFNVNRTTGLITNVSALDQIIKYNLQDMVNDTKGNSKICYFWINMIPPSAPSNVTMTSAQLCVYKKYGYYNLKLPWFRQENCI